MKLNHEIIEKNTGLLVILIVVAISFATRYGADEAKIY